MGRKPPNSPNGPLRTCGQVWLARIWWPPCVVYVLVKLPELGLYVLEALLDCEISWERVLYLSALEVCSRQGAIQIHVYLTQIFHIHFKTRLTAQYVANCRWVPFTWMKNMRKLSYNQSKCSLCSLISQPFVDQSLSNFAHM